MFTFSEMLALVQSESSFGAFVFHRRPAGLQATSDLVNLNILLRTVTQTSFVVAVVLVVLVPVV